jgi:diguanylate cyclase (GGDEF)-like protein
MRKTFGLLILILLWAVSAVAQVPEQVVHVGITSFRDKSATLKEWQPTMDFLMASIPGTRFEVVPLNLPEFEGALRDKKLDFLITNPQHYIAVEAIHAVSRIGTLVKRENGQIVNQFGGVIFARSDRTDIDSLASVKGKRIAATDKTSFAAYLIQYDIFKTEGIDLEKDCDTHFLGFPQDLSVQAVLKGEADVGFGRSGLIESMVREGKLDANKLKVLHRTHATDFPFLVSSALFPEWPIAAAPHVPIDIRNQVTAALLLMPADSDAAKAGRYNRWSTPVEYLSVQQFMQRLHIYPYDKPEVTLQSLLREYALQLVSIVASLAFAIGLLYWRSLRLNHQLLASRQALRDMAHHDALTGLPNRVLLTDRLEQLMAQGRRSKQALALCMLDLDGFKPVNDLYGHAVGDKVLCEVAQRITAALRESDTVARFGGDEFVLLLGDVVDDAQLNDVLHRVLASITRPMEICPTAKISASIGVSVLGADACDETELMRHADAAMYKAKAAGGHRFVRYA